MSANRSIDELIGICRGVLADGMLVQEETEFLLAWMKRHRDVASRWPANVLYARISRALEDGVIDTDEERDLLRLLLRIESDSAEEEASFALCDTPLDHPPPPIVFTGKHFCFTGELVCGSRHYGESCVLDRGGHISKNVTAQTDYLVIGSAGSPAWSSSTFGRKIERAVELRQRGIGIAIVAEHHWCESLEASAR